MLLADGDAASAKKVKEMLEYAGYMVTVEGDGKQVKMLTIGGLRLMRGFAEG